jgi:protein-arginine kinase activator protein McsA
MSAAPSIEKEEEEEKQHQAELQRAQDQLKKCLENEDYTGAAAV